MGTKEPIAKFMEASFISIPTEAMHRAERRNPSQIQKKRDSSDALGMEGKANHSLPGIIKSALDFAARCETDVHWAPVLLVVK